MNLKFAVVVLALVWFALLYALDAQADQWTFFYPELVRNYGCRVRTVQLVEAAGGRNEVWEAEAYADRIREGNSMEHWDFVLGYFDHGDKGARKAGTACFKWREQAAKRVRAAQR